MANEKRITKHQKEQAERATLLRRVIDIYSGGCGRDMGGEDSFIGMHEASIIVPALRDIFAKQVPGKDYLWQPHMLDKYESPTEAARHLYGYGIRA